MEDKLYNQEGQEAGKISLPSEVFDLPWSNDLVHQVVIAHNSNVRNNIAYAKDRSDVSGGGRKPWRQKGTGRARHGSSRSPIWAGGGVTHGPTKEKNYEKKINKKMKSKSLKIALSAKKRDKEIIFIDSLLDESVKARKFLKTLAGVGFDKLIYEKGKRGLIIVPQLNQQIHINFRNFSTIKVLPVSDLNTVDVLKYDYLIVLKAAESVENLVNRLE